MILIYFITDNVDLDHLAKVVFAGFLHPSVASESGAKGNIFFET